MTTAKICGLKTPEAVQAALDGGASHIGFIFFEKSPRHLDPGTAARLAEPARGKARVVAVTVDADDAALDRINGLLQPDFFQLHGRETPARAHEIRTRTGAGVIRAVSVADASDVETAAAYEPVVDHLMFDAKTPPGATLPGGLGHAFDWALVKDRRLARPWFLAGGLDPWNVAEALKTTGAPLVDVSSGVEKGAGIKNPALISAFLEAVRRA